jgi:hypothetical protein
MVILPWAQNEEAQEKGREGVTVIYYDVCVYWLYTRCIVLML